MVSKGRALFTWFTSITSFTGPCAAGVSGQIVKPSCLWPYSSYFPIPCRPHSRLNKSPVVSETRDGAGLSIFAFLMVSITSFTITSVVESRFCASCHVRWCWAWFALFYVSHCKSFCSGDVERPCLTSINDNRQNIFIKQLSLGFDCWQDLSWCYKLFQKPPSFPKYT